MRFTKIPAETFKTIQLNAGIIVDSFTPSTGAIGNIIGATSGGVSFKATPAFNDFADGIDNAPKNLKEFKRADQWTATMSGTYATITSDLANLLVAMGDISGRNYVLTTDTAIKAGKKYYARSGESPDYVYTQVANPVVADIATYYIISPSSIEKITPRNDLQLSDFTDVWWVGDYSAFNGDTNGGFVAIHLINSLSTGGFSLQSGDKAKGQQAFEFTGHYSNDNPDTVPFEIYIKVGTAESAST